MKRVDWFVPWIAAVLIAFGVASCAPRPVDTPENNDVSPEIPDVEERGLLVPPREQRLQLLRIDRRELPAPVSRWIDNSLQLYATGYTDTKVFDDKTYIVVARGERPTGGYEVRIMDALLRDDHVEVRVRFTRPGPEAMVTQAITYPHDVAAIRATDISIRIIPEGNDRPSRIAQLRGIDSLENITASSHTIKVFEPAPRTETGRTIPLSGVALLPEGNVFYKLLDSDGMVRKVGGTLTASPLDWGYFETEITVPDEIPDGTAFQLVLFRFDDAAQQESDQVPIRLTVRSSHPE